jgi:hypothetical protein
MNKSIRLVILAAIALAATATFAQTDAQKAFNAIKNMPGTWEGQTSEGDTVQVNFKTVSRGSAIVSEILGKEDMISVFNLDGSRLLMTHYCAMGNQPRMQASLSPDGKTITFTYVDATNLATPDAGHMQRMVLTVLDENHHIEEWTFADHGKEHKAVFDLHRKA